MVCFKYIIYLNLFILIVKSDKLNTPEVHEEIREDERYELENIRVTRHPKFPSTHEPPTFDYKKMTQQDPQRIRYVQQQKLDSYVRAFHQEQASRSSQKHRKSEKVRDQPRDIRIKSENRQSSPKPIEFNLAEVTIDQHPKKVVDLKQLNIDNSQDELINVDKKTSEEKASSKRKLGYQVSEDIFDMETASSNNKESRIYFGQNELLKALQDTSVVSPSYLTKPAYVFANPQLDQLNLDPNSLMHGLNFVLPENHQLSSAGFKPPTKSDIEALSSLLGKSPNIQLQGLNELLNHQQGYALSAVPLPEAQVHLKDVPIQAQHLVKEFTPIKEDVVDVARPKFKPAIQSPQTQIAAQSHVENNQNFASESKKKSVYEDYDDKLQYAAQYAFGYKIRDFHSGNNFGHEEMRDGNIAKGHYHVLLPDGRLQNVEYWADPSGYHAKVTYSSAAHH